MSIRCIYVHLKPRFLTERAWQWFLLITLIAAFAFPSVNSSTFEITSSCVAQAQATPEDPQPDLSKAMKYHAALLRRPTPGYLYDRFYNTWLDNSSQEELKQFLIERTNAAAAKSADRLLLAFFYAKQGKDVEALQQFRVALQNNPDNCCHAIRNGGYRSPHARLRFRT